ncbi:MAG: outer membrane beta-barrel protein, partial [Draconibacterium sp.]|nr:outer membrane beta-barrel protein [Draconibacterium sp.]
KEAGDDDNNIENTRKDLQNNNNTLIATTQKTSDKSDIASTIPIYKRIEMKMIESIGIQFNNEQPEILLAENAIPNKKYHLTETDKLLIASNVTSVKSKNRTETGWKVGIGITPAYSSSVVSYSESYSKNMNYSDESSNGNIGGGFSIQYKTSKKLRIESGVYYAQNGQTSTNTVQLFTNRETADYAMAAPKKAVYANTVKVSKGNMAMNSTAGVIVMSATPKGAEINSELDAFNPQSSNSIVSDGEFSQVFDFVEIPLYLRYRVLDSKFGIELVGGVNAGVVVGNNAYIDNSYGLQNIGETEDISTVNLSGTVGVGLNYALGKHISMAVEPRLNYYFNSINENPDVDFRPYRVGIFTGLYYEF